jgi:methyl-accepting chemotaxis protein
MKLSRKFLTINLTALVILLIVILAIGYSYYNNIREESIAKRVESIKKVYKDNLDAKKEIWIGNALLIANNPKVKTCLLDTNRKELARAVNKLGNSFKENTGFKNIKVHIIDRNLKSFYKSWAPDDYGESLAYSSGYKKVRRSQEAQVAMEVSPKGLRLKGLFPIFHEGKFLGIANFEGGLNSIKRKLEPHHTDFLYFMNEGDLDVARELEDNMEFKQYVLSQNDINQEFLDYVRNDMAFSDLSENGFHLDDQYLTIRGHFKDFSGDDTGLYVLGMKRKQVMKQVHQTKNMLFTVLGVLFGIFVLFMILLNYFVNRMIIKPVNKGVAFAESIASGDLTTRIDVHQKDEIGQLAGALRNMSDKLEKIVTNIQNGANNISAASDQISASSQQMSQGASEQASSAEEVSSSMEQMKANIQQNTDNAQQTEKISMNTTESIKKGNEATQNSASSMREIAEKISIINDIAFQTNILALNAAVEAARAGEHGKGFAVVASEVRKLAERSGEAAKEIDEKSRSGVQIAEEAGQQLSEIVPEVEKTSQLVQEITSASNEMNSGADQVNNAIQQLNQVTQQNASSSEELASNAEELSSQADELKQAIRFFKVNGAHHQTVQSSSFGSQQISNPQARAQEDSPHKSNIYETAGQASEKAKNLQNSGNNQEGSGGRAPKSDSGVDLKMYNSSSDSDFENY